MATVDPKPAPKIAPRQGTVAAALLLHGIPKDESGRTVAVEITDNVTARVTQISGKVQATTKAAALRQVEQARYSELAERTRNADSEIDRLHSAADSFRAARRLKGRPGNIAGGTGGGAVTLGADRAAGDRDGPGADAVALTGAEFDQFRDNTLRLEQVRR